MTPADTEVTVRTEVMKPGGAPVQIDYSMEKTPSGWKAYDVIVAGVSLVTNYRDEFNEQIKSGGVDGLHQDARREEQGSPCQVMAERSARVSARGAVFRASEDGGAGAPAATLTFANAGVALAAAQALPLPSTGVVDCAKGSRRSDSAAVALLLSLKRRGAERGRPLTFVEVPAALKALAALYDVEDILGA